MTRRIAGLPVWGPADVLDGMRALVGWTDEAVTVVGGLPERVSALLDEIEGLVGRVGALADRIDGVVDRVEGVVTRADAVAEQADVIVVRAGSAADGAAVVIEQATAVAARAGEVVAHASDTSGSARDLLTTYLPIAEQAAPLARQFVSEFSQDELHALIRLVDHMPAFTEHLEDDIMPILATLDRVGPDVHELLDVLKDVRQAINGIPGFAYFRRRGSDGD
ncbi:hypothetical protein [Pseudonocardia sp.]|uniref:hypothetical protein n=1 Tax=Pseudonocardia sp. TaxID=60912 RepID=UPI003D13EAAC